MRTTPDTQRRHSASPRSELGEKLIAYLDILLGGGTAGATLAKHHRLRDYLWERANDERMLQRGPDGKLRWGWRDANGRIRLWQRPRDKAVLLRGYNVDSYSWPVRKAAWEKLRRYGVESLTPLEYSALFSAKDSMTQPAFAAADALNEGGVKVKLYNPFSDGRNGLKSVERDKNIGAVLQVGHDHFPFESTRIGDRGLYSTRLLTDYGDGAFRQPFRVMDTEPNGMAVRPMLDRYDTVYIPGGDLKRWNGIPRGQHTISVDGLATSPLFENYTFRASEPGFSPVGRKAKAILTSGGGSGRGLLFETGPEMFPGDGKLRTKSLLRAENNTFDYLLNALRRKHGNDFSLDFLSGLAEHGTSLSPGIAEHIAGVTAADVLRMASGRASFTQNVDKDLSILATILDKGSPLRRELLSSEAGSNLVRSIDQRYSGLNILRSLSHPQMAESYRNADYLVGLSGSSLGEIASIKGDTHGGLIHLIPHEAPSRARHFRGNAEVANILMQPGAKHNIVSISSPTFGEDLAKAVSESGTKNWGRVHGWKTGPAALKPLVEDLAKHVKWSPKVTARHLGRTGLLFGGLALLGRGVNKRLGVSSSNKGVQPIEKKSSADLQSAYRMGFMRKCAELKVDDRLSNALCIGALLRRSRMRNASSLT